MGVVVRVVWERVRGREGERERGRKGEEGGGGGTDVIIHTWWWWWFHPPSPSSLPHTQNHHHLDVGQDALHRQDGMPHVTDASSELIVGTPSKKIAGCHCHICSLPQYLPSPWNSNVLEMSRAPWIRHKESANCCSQTVVRYQRGGLTWS